METFKDQFNKLPEDIKTKVFNYCPDRLLSEKCSNIASSILESFLWFKTSEGWNYWYMIYTKYKNTEQHGQ